MALPKRKNIRLKNYDYSQNGAYFITICVKDKHCILWDTVGAISNRPHNDNNTTTPFVELSKTGKIAENVLSELNEKIIIDKYIIMPNHIHMIIIIGLDNGGRTEFGSTISSIIRFYKSSVTKQIGYSIWQKSFHDHIIRNEADYQRIWQYIDENPVKWDEDCYNENNNPSKRSQEGVLT